MRVALALAALGGISLLWRPSPGVFPWLAAGVLWVRWSRSGRRERIVGSLKFLVFFWFVCAVVTGQVAQLRMTPVPLPTLRSSWLLASVLVVIHGGDEALRRWLEQAGAALADRLGWSERRRRLAIWSPLGALLSASLVFSLGLPAFLLSAAVHRPQGTVALSSVEAEGRGEAIRLRSADGTSLSALWFPHPEPRGAVLLVHGIGAEKVQFLPATRPLYDRGMSVLTLDLRNHGESGGATCTLGLREAEDVAAAWRLLRERTAGQPGPRVLFGISLGGGAVQLAAPGLDGVDGLILDSTFARIEHLAVRVMPLPWALPLGRLLAPLITGMQVLDSAPIEAAQRNRGDYPIMVIHAVGDPLVPYEEGKAVAAAYGARAELVTLPGAHHPNGHLFAPELYREALERLASRAASHHD
jgi:hypothetical protein